ncbi:MAG: 6,7-dimethyl-8-ribityllumazine synthase [Deltaproteobacteria bacterium]|jgi:6,7-dimethyl-8-ribityllumazine synthase|nr:6,7-dimethyl-8-ribityllumazine synthase [Deltaproteobacteria bacterium]
MPHIHQGNWSAKGKRFAILASRWNEFIADKLVEGALDALAKAGADEGAIEIFRCPGAFELPGLTRRLADSGRFDALVCLGVIIRGATPHFDVVVNQVTRGIAGIAAEAKLAIGFGVLTCDSIEQAIERSGSKGGNRGADAAITAVEMANLYAALAGDSRAETHPAGKPRKR